MKKIIMFSFIGSVMSFPAAADDLLEMQNKSEQLGLISVDEAKSIALKTKPGIVEDVELENRAFAGGWDYEMEVVGKDGKEWIFISMPRPVM